MDLVDLAHAAAERDAGMKAALDHADRVEPKWSSEAYSFLLSYARAHLYFISEDVSNAALVAGIAQPPTLRAYGSLYRRAAKEGIIVQDGTGRSARRHASICPRWRSRIFQGSAA